MRVFFFFSILFFFFYKYIIYLFIFYCLIIINNWWRDVTRESTYIRFHSPIVKKNIYFGIILFIISEIFFFFGFFWTFFHSSLSLSVDLINWPPIRIYTFNPLRVPFLNTIVLLSSRFTITWSHYEFLSNNFYYCFWGIILTIILRIFFTFLQLIEYNESTYCFNDSVFGSIFFLRTRFHRFHVLIRTIFLIISIIRLINGHFNKNNHVRLECSIWYWHFVDVVWIFLYLFFYWWRRNL